MPDESCRRCGGILLNYIICAKCRAPVQFICRICAMKTLERFHDGLCFRPENGFNKNKEDISSNFSLGINTSSFLLTGKKLRE